MPLTLDLSQIVDGQQIDAADVIVPMNQVKAFVDGNETNIATNTGNIATNTTAISNLRTGVTTFDQLRYATPEALTINAGAVTATKTRLTIDTEGATATDDLDTVSGLQAGDLVIISSANDARNVVIKHNTGNLRNFSGHDLTLDLTTQVWYGVYDGTYLCQINGTDYGLRAFTQIATTPTIYRTLVLPNRALSVPAWGTQLNMALPIVQENRFEFRASGATVLGSMVANPTVTGSAAFSNQGDTTYVFINSAASAGAAASIESTTFNLCTPLHEPTFEVLLRASLDVTNVRIMLGLFSAGQTNTDDPSGSAIGFRFSTVAGDPGWRPFTDDGTTMNVGANMGAVVAAAATRLRIRVNAGAAYFSVNNGAEVTISSNLPASTTPLGVAIYTWAQAASARSTLFSRCSVTYN